MAPLDVSLLPTTLPHFFDGRPSTGAAASQGRRARAPRPRKLRDQDDPL